MKNDIFLLFFLYFIPNLYIIVSKTWCTIEKKKMKVIISVSSEFNYWEKHIFIQSNVVNGDVQKIQI